MPKYQLEIGLKCDTIEHVKEIEARNLDEAYEIGSSWAIEEYCIVLATPVDDAGKLTADFDELIKSIRSTMRSLSQNKISGDEFRSPEGVVWASRFLQEMNHSINDSMWRAIDTTPIKEKD